MVQILGWLSADSSLRFPLETGEGLADLWRPRRAEISALQSGASFSVLGLVDDTHPATAQLLDDAVVRDGLADHDARMLWRNAIGKSMKAEELAVSQEDCWRKIAITLIVGTAVLSLGQ